MRQQRKLKTVPFSLSLCKNSPWAVLQALFWTHKALGGLVPISLYLAMSQCALPCCLHSSHTVLLIPSHTQCVPPTSGPLYMLFTLSGMPYLLPFHPANSHSSLRTQPKSICSPGRFLWNPWCERKCVCVRARARVHTSARFVDGKGRERI